MTGGAAGRQHHRHTVGQGSFRAATVIVAPSRIRQQGFAIEGNRPIERNDHDSLQRRHHLLHAVDFLEQAARQPWRRRQQQLRLDGVELGNDGVAREQQVERLGNAAGRSTPDRSDGRRPVRQQDRDRVALADARSAKVIFGCLDAAHQMVAGHDNRIGIERRAQIDDGLALRIGQRPARDQVENARAGGQRLAHVLFARGLLGRREPVLQHVSADLIVLWQSLAQVRGRRNGKLHRGRGASCRGQAPQRSAAVCTGASHSRFARSSSTDRVIETPAISSDVT